jgi:hypothetical protein
MIVNKELKFPKVYVQNNSKWEIDAYSFQFSEDSKKFIRNRKRKNSLPEIQKQLKSLINLVNSREISTIHGRPKNVNALGEDNSGRRSMFIGVSKNGQNWQVLINMGKFKKYIGTYPTEKEAAIAYDFYSICLHLKKAKTNFTYDKDVLLDMIQCYKENKNVFDPVRFLSVV